MLPFSDERIFRRDLGSQGEYVLNFLSEWGSDVLDDADPRIVDKFSKRTVIAQVVDWLQDTSPGSRLDIRKLGDVDALTARYSYDRKGDVPSRPFRPTNVGFGLSYVLPVITALISARAGDLVVIENPEAHVHPRGQTKLGQLACRAVAAGVQVIVETHSDHFLDGVRIDVRDKVLSNTDVALHYFSRHGAEAMVHGPVLQSDGRLSDWPEGFFDQHATNMSRLLAPPAR
jgi:predicted ATPase